MTDLVQAAESGEPAAAPKITSSMIKAALRVHFEAPAYAVFFEVSNDTGGRAKTYTDAVAMGIWPSTGQEIIGVEIKVSRSDWLREIKNPAKTSPMFNSCDRFYLACPAGLVKADEVPINWGVLHFDGTRTKVAKKAPPLAPEPLTRGLMAALIRRAGEVDSEVVGEAVRKAVAAERRDREAAIERAIKQAADRRGDEERSAAKKLARIEAITGIDMGGWDADAETVGRAIKAVHASGTVSSFGGLQGLLNTVRSFEKQLAAALDGAGVTPEGEA